LYIEKEELQLGNVIFISDFYKICSPLTMSVKLSIDEDLFLLRTSPGILERIFFFKHWSYGIELPVSRIVRVEVERRLGVCTLIVVKSTVEGIDKSIPLSLAKATNKQIDFIKHALPGIIENKPLMSEIKALEKKYLNPKKHATIID